MERIVRDLYPTARDVPFFGKVEQILGTIEAEYHIGLIMDLELLSHIGTIRGTFAFSHAPQTKGNDHKFWWDLADKVERL